jgi:hypothetical protein
MRGFSVSGADMAIATAPGREAEEAGGFVLGGIRAPAQNHSPCKS